MSGALTLLILRIGFLLLLWLFIFAIVYALRSDLFGGPVRRMPNGAASGSGGQTPAGPAAVAVVSAAPAAAPTAPTGQVGGVDQAFLTPSGTAPITPSGGALPSAGGIGGAAGANTMTNEPARVLVITSGKAAGTSIPLDTDIITIGRSADSTLVIVDEYTSTYHARLSRSGERWTLTDLDSTNGTKLAGTRVTDQVPLPTFTPVTIGTTTFELRP